MLGFFQCGVLIIIPAVNSLACFFWCNIMPLDGYRPCNEIGGHGVNVNTAKMVVPVCTSPSWDSHVTRSVGSGLLATSLQWGKSRNWEWTLSNSYGEVTLLWLQIHGQQPCLIVQRRFRCHMSSGGTGGRGSPLVVLSGTRFPSAMLWKFEKKKEGWCFTACSMRSTGGWQFWCCHILANIR